MKKPEIKEHTPIQPRPLTPIVRTPQCGHTVWGTRHVSGMWVTMSLMCEMCFTCHSFFLSSSPGPCGFCLSGRRPGKTCCAQNTRVTATTATTARSWHDGRVLLLCQIGDSRRRASPRFVDWPQRQKVFPLEHAFGCISRTFYAWSPWGPGLFYDFILRQWKTSSWQPQWAVAMNGNDVNISVRSRGIRSTQQHFQTLWRQINSWQAAWKLFAKKSPLELAGAAGLPARGLNWNAASKQKHISTKTACQAKTAHMPSHAFKQLRWISSP